MNDLAQKGNFQTVQIIYGALILGVLVFTIIAFFLIANHTINIDVTNIFTILVPIAAILGVYLSYFIYNSILSKADTNVSLLSKLAKYQSALIIKAACLEGPAFLAIVAAFNSENVSYLLISMLMLLIMFMHFPTKEKFKSELKLNMKEKSDLDKL